MNTPAYLTLPEAADYIRLSRDTLKAAIHEGRLSARKSGKGGGGRIIIRRTDLDAWFEAMRAA